MRALPARRLASTALCAALLAGVAGPAAAAAPAHERTRATHRAPAPGADALLGRTRSLGDLAAVLAPVTDLLTAALKADNGQLAPERAARLAAAARSAITRLTAPAPAQQSTAQQSAPARPAAVAQAKGLGGEPTAKELTDDALKSLQTAIDNLVKAVTSGDAGQVAPAGTAVLTGLADYLAALLLGGGLPAPARAARPTLPGLPATVLLPPPSS
ncbi:hypothetical protein [Streptomyces fuscichromogenes]|uniref:Secreted protein n=1 Tax=Streptomyces fuscichromogenes TaxID=1324013 RepID=A0A917UGR5_9ACTN|nr:hypothetical protein [Streptomyces fuscichromogenes]GGM92367.1 hypothetical protein GCM10011578_010440 [Streptomyces fuscichromogenes]